MLNKKSLCKEENVFTSIIKVVYYGATWVTFKPKLKTKKIDTENFFYILGNEFFESEKPNKTLLNFLALKKLNKTFLYSLLIKLP